MRILGAGFQACTSPLLFAFAREPGAARVSKGRLTAKEGRNSVLISRKHFLSLKLEQPDVLCGRYCLRKGDHLILQIREHFKNESLDSLGESELLLACFERLLKNILYGCDAMDVNELWLACCNLLCANPCCERFGLSLR